MKVLDLGSLGSLRSAEIEPDGSIHLSSGGVVRRTATGGEAAWCNLLLSSDDLWRVAVNEYKTTRS